MSLSRISVLLLISFVLYTRATVNLLADTEICVRYGALSCRDYVFDNSVNNTHKYSLMIQLNDALLLLIKNDLVNATFSVMIITNINTNVSARIEFLSDENTTLTDDNICNGVNNSISCFWSSDETAIDSSEKKIGTLESISVPTSTQYVRIVIFLEPGISFSIFDPKLEIESLLTMRPGEATLVTLSPIEFRNVNLSWHLPEVNGDRSNYFTSVTVVRIDSPTEEPTEEVIICVGGIYLDSCIDESPPIDAGIVRYDIVVRNYINDSRVSKDWHTWSTPRFFDFEATAESPVSIAITLKNFDINPPISSYEFFLNDELDQNISSDFVDESNVFLLNSFKIKPNSEYLIKVKAKNVLGEKSSNFTVTTPMVVVDAPSISVQESYVVTVLASVPVTRPFSKVEIFAEGFGDSVITNTNISNLTQVLTTFKELHPRESYTFHLKWTNADDEYVSPTVEIVLPPDFKEISLIGPRSLSIELPQSIDPILEYRVTLSNPVTGDVVKEDSILSKVASVATFNGLTAETRYKLSIVAIDKDGVRSAPFIMTVSTLPEVNSEKGSEKESKTGGNKGGIIAGVIVAVCIVAIGLVAVYIIKRKPSSKDTENSKERISEVLHQPKSEVLYEVSLPPQPDVPCIEPLQVEPDNVYDSPQNIA